LVPETDFCFSFGDDENDDDWGPRFGNFGALYISDKCNEKAFSYTHGIGGSFNALEPEKRFHYKSQEASKAINGA
jgi:hypothetical protein